MNNKLHINGIAHIALNVSNISKSKLFYDKILPHLGMKLVHSSIKSFYYNYVPDKGVFENKVKFNPSDDY